MQTELVNSIMNNLKIEKDMFSVSMVEDCLEGIAPTQYKAFYNALMGDEHEYLKPLDRVAKVAKQFKGTRSDELFKDVQSTAKSFYDKIYTINASMTTHSQENREAIPNDREFFENMDYSALINKADNSKILNKQDLYILDELGGGEWVMNIKFITNSSEALGKIEHIIKNAITLKHLTPKHDAIASNIKGLLK